MFNGATIEPTAGVNRTNNTVDLGSSTYRFKDLFLSGGAYLGGTAAANKLDDYEEGTWTPVIRAAGGNTVTGQSNVQAAYTKIGRLVQVSAYISSIDMTLMTSGTYVLIQGLPFACTIYGDFNISYRRGGTAFQGGYVQTGTSYLYFVDDNGSEIVQANNQTMTAFMLNVTYMAS